MADYRDQIDRVRRDALFANCASLQLARVLGKLEPVTFAAGQDLYSRGSKADALYLLDGGDVELITESGRRMELQAPRCGEEAATDLKTYLATATARTPVQALRLPREALTELGMASRAMLGLTSHLSGEALLPAPKPTAAPAAPPVPRKQVVGWLAVLLVPPVLYFAGGSAGLTQEAALFVGILAATVLMWLFGLADEYVPPLLAVAAVLMVGLVPSDIALGGFASRTLTTLIGVYALARSSVVVVTLTHVVAMRLSFAREPQTPLPKDRLREQQALLGPVTVSEKGALLGFVLFVVGAFTVSWHQVNPAWLAAFILVALLLTGLVSKKDFQQKIDWPMIFFLLSLDGLSRSISYLGLDTALSAAVGDRFNFVDGNLLLFIPVALAVTLLLRLALPITAGMVVAAVVLMPVAASQDIHPWVLTFLTAMFSDMWFKPYQSSQCLQLASSGYGSYIADPGFRRYNHFINASRIVAAYASVPYWQWLGLA
jgi:hypothetical protein